MKRKLKMLIFSLLLLIIIVPSCKKNIKDDAENEVATFDISSIHELSPIAIGKEIIVSTNDGKVYKIGNTEFCEYVYEDGNREYFHIWDKAILVPELENIVSVYGDYETYFALDSNGDVWAWGSNEYGQLSLNDAAFIDKPIKINSANDIIEVFPGGYSPAFLTIKNTILSIGMEGSNYLDCYSKEDLTNIKDSEYRFVLKNDGSVYYLMFGNENDSALPLSIRKIEIDEKVVKIYSGSRNISYARTEDGSIYSFCSIGVTADKPVKITLPSNVVEMSQSGQAFINNEGKIVSLYGEELLHPDIKDIVYIADCNINQEETQFGHSAIVLKNNGTLYHYTVNPDGEYEYIAEITTVSDVGPWTPLYYGQCIGQDGNENIADNQGFYFQ